MGDSELLERGTMTQTATDTELLAPRIEAATRPSEPARIGVPVIGELIALMDGGRTPLVRRVGADGAAIRARSIVDLQGRHIGRPVVLLFEDGRADRPIVMGVLRDETDLPFDAPPGCVEVHADGERMVVSARDQLVLRCGCASITLTKAGKVLIQGAYVLSRSFGVNRIKGGSVQIN